ncbi:hypothetical protein BA177_04405 [Woeseia oceani]|uniref:Integrase catalytic domain-containing protein n=1 Tax=Woeseia oceani TaxID=1548547 RepID=A0A193LDK2_9GAMM|nr:hypothetical protein BA177_04405 [Woeseia oceani]
MHSTIIPAAPNTSCCNEGKCGRLVDRPAHEKSAGNPGLDDGDQSKKTAGGLIHHSDRGSQYASYDYQKLLKQHKMICSMSRKGNC